MKTIKAIPPAAAEAQAETTNEIETIEAYAVEADGTRVIDLVGLDPDADASTIDEFIRAEADGEIIQVGTDRDGVLWFKKYVD